MGSIEYGSCLTLGADGNGCEIAVGNSFQYFVAGRRGTFQRAACQRYVSAIACQQLTDTTTDRAGPAKHDRLCRAELDMAIRRHDRGRGCRIASVRIQHQRYAYGAKKGIFTSNEYLFGIFDVRSAYKDRGVL